MKITIFSILSMFLCISASAQEDSEIRIHDIVQDVLQKDADSLDRFKPTFNGYPYAFYSPETELAFGAGGIFVFHTGTDTITYPSKMTFGAYYTTTDNYKFNINPAFYFRENKVFFKVPMSYGFYVDKYWGIGDDTEELGTESYSRQEFAVNMHFQSPPLVFAADRSGLVIEYNNNEIKDKKENTLLQDSLLTGYDGGTLWGIGVDMTWDDRDHVFFPNSGGYQYFKFMFYPSGISDFSYIDIELDVRHFWAVKKDHVIGTSFFLKNVSGDVPFYKTPAMGGFERMRGYFTGRYRDRFYSAVQVEYRQYVWRKFGIVAFGGFGNVSSEMIEFDFQSMKPSYGAGLRFLFNKEQKINLRADFGVGADGNTGVYFGIEEAF